MPHPTDPRALCCEFERSYALGSSPLLLELDHSVFGRDYVATSWTTRDEADRVADGLRLGPGVRLLDVGAGSGWPGLYLAQLTGCDVVLADMPFTGLRVASGRAVQDGLGDRIRIVAADGARLPFADSTFAAVSHSDVLCCMPAKLAMLRECHRVAREGARMVFSVVVVAPDLPEPERKTAIDSGPPFVESPADYSVLLAQSGWRVLEREDLTPAYVRTARALVDGMASRAEALGELLGPAEFAESTQCRQAAYVAAARGLLRRELFVAATSDRCWSG